MGKFILPTMIILALMISASPVIAEIDGTEIWKENGYIKYNFVSESQGTEVTGSIKVTYQKISGNNMEFQVSEEFGGNTEDTAVTVDKTTGLDSDGNWTGYFTDTSDFEVGRYPSNVDPSAEGSQYEIVEDTTATYVIQGDDTSVNIWRLSYQENDGTSDMVLSKNGGVLLEMNVNSSIGSLSIIATYIDGVQLSSSFLSLDAPFWSILLVGFPVLLYIKRRKSN